MKSDYEESEQDDFVLEDFQIKKTAPYKSKAEQIADLEIVLEIVKNDRDRWVARSVELEGQLTNLLRQQKYERHKLKQKISKHKKQVRNITQENLLLPAPLREFFEQEALLAKQKPEDSKAPVFHVLQKGSEEPPVGSIIANFSGCSWFRFGDFWYSYGKKPTLFQDFADDEFLLLRKGWGIEK